MRKNILPIIILTVILTSSFLANSETNKTVENTSHTDTLNWIGLLETGTECEIYYTLTQCGEDKKLLLKYYNEMPLNQKIRFKVTVKYLGYAVTEEKTKNVAPNQTISAECSSSDSTLFIKLLPPNWDFNKTTVTAELMEATN
ncbi:hypothetical protein WG954_19685 [Lacibacter sp. H375]|uniref:hypothetical protein n=1 Tax=Lacibacter sp. H375 TaxID=3133424 RepID=UPI0030BAB00F